MIAILVALLLQSAYPAPPPQPVLFARALQDDPPPRHDKYRDDPAARCVIPAVAEYYQNPSTHACTCPLQCMENRDGDGTLTGTGQAEQPSCELYCTKARCGCHPEECERPPDVEPPK